MTHTTTAQRVVGDYYDILAGDGLDRDALRAILAPDLLFEGPVAGQRVGAEAFVTGVAGFVETCESLDFTQQMFTDDGAAAVYDARMPGGQVRFAEFFEVRGDRIHALRLMFDPTDYRAKGGR